MSPEDLISAFPVPALLVCEDGRIEAASEEAAVLVGRTREELRGQLLGRLLHPRHEARVLEGIEKISPLDPPTVEITELDPRLALGLQSVYELRISAVPSPQGEAALRVVTLTEMSQLHRIRQGLEDERRKALRLEVLTRDFLGNLAYELRTPMTAIVGFVDLLLAEEELSDEQRRRLDKVLDASRNLLYTIRNFTELAALELGESQVALQSFATVDLIERLQSQLDNLENGSALTVEHKELPEAFEGDSSRLRLLLASLMTVAAQCGDEDLGAKLQWDAGVLRLRLRFDQADAARDLVRAMLGGRVESIGGRPMRRRLDAALGAQLIRFLEARIRLVPPSTVELAVPIHEPSSRSVAKSRSGPIEKRSGRILVVDDDSITRQLLSYFIARLGLECVALGTGHEALELLERDRDFDLGIIDIFLPDISGLETGRRIRSDLELKMPLLALSARFVGGERPACEDAGFDDFLAKPMTFAQIAEAIGRLVRTDTVD